MKHLPEIFIKIIPHNQQRYNTAGDYFLEKGVWQFRISEMKSIFYEVFVLFHELWEWFRVCIIKGIKEEDIAKFDIAWQGEKHIFSEAGNDPKAPYHKEHLESTALEKFLVRKAKMKWSVYNKSFDKLKYK